MGRKRADGVKGAAAATVGKKEKKEKNVDRKLSAKDKKDAKRKSGGGARPAARVTPPALDSLPVEVLVCILSAGSAGSGVDADSLLPGRDWASVAATCTALRNAVEVARSLILGVGEAAIVGEMHAASIAYVSAEDPARGEQAVREAYIDGGLMLILGEAGVPPWPAGGPRAEGWRAAVSRADKLCSKRREAFDVGFTHFNDLKINEAIHAWRRGRVFSSYAALLAHARGEPFTKLPLSPTKAESDAAAVATFLWHFMEDATPENPQELGSSKKSKRRGISFMSRVVATKGHVLNPASLTVLLSSRPNVAIVDNFMSSFDFVNLDIVEAICDVLNFVHGASVVDAGVFIESFGRSYYEQNPTYYFKSSRAVSNTAYAIVRLRYIEDAAEAKRVSKEKDPADADAKPMRLNNSINIPMKKFISNMKGINDGENLPEPFVEHLYNRVLVFGLVPHVQRESGRIHKTGFLHKQGTDVLRRWKRRWFVLCDSELSYTANARPEGSKSGGLSLKASGGSGVGLASLSSGKNMLGKIDLSSSTFHVIKPSGGGKEHKRQGSTSGSFLTGSTANHSCLQFKVTNPKDGRAPFILQCESQEEFLEWVALLQPLCRAPVEDARGESIGSLGMEDESSSSPRIMSEAEEVANIVSPYFNTPVADIIERERELVASEIAAGNPAHIDVPLLLSRAFSYLKRDIWLEEEGLLRLSGSQASMDSFWARIEQSPKGPLAVDFSSEKIDPHAVTGMMKKWLRELPDLLFEKADNDEILAMLQLVGTVGEEHEVMLKPEVKRIIDSLSPAWRLGILRELIAFLIQVVAHCDKNKMGIDNVLRVMTPSMHCAPVFLSMPMNDFEYFFPPKKDDETPGQEITDEGNAAVGSNSETKESSSDSAPSKESASDMSDSKESDNDNSGSKEPAIDNNGSEEPVCDSSGSDLADSAQDSDVQEGSVITDEAPKTKRSKKEKRASQQNLETLEDGLAEADVGGATLAPIASPADIPPVKVEKSRKRSSTEVEPVDAPKDEPRKKRDSKTINLSDVEKCEDGDANPVSAEEEGEVSGDVSKEASVKGAKKSRRKEKKSKRSKKSKERVAVP